MVAIKPSSNTRALMAMLVDLNLDAIVIDHDDPHATEVPHPAFEGLQFVSNFSGSWGKALVTREIAYLWTDSRYFIQAAKQLQEPWQLMRVGEKGVPDIAEVITKGNLKRVGIDAHTTHNRWLDHHEKLLKGVEFVRLYDNPVYQLWKDGRPKFPSDPVCIHSEDFAGLSTDVKLSEIRRQMSESEADAIVFSELDEIAYVLNLRGSDSDVSPIFYAFFILEKQAATLVYHVYSPFIYRLFIEPCKLTDDVKTYLKSHNIAIQEYSALLSYLETIANKSPRNADKPFKLWVSPTASVAICNSFLSKGSIEAPRVLLQQDTPACTMKAVKNVVELQGMKEAHILDGIALARFFALVENMKKEGTLYEISELDLGDLSTQCRAEIKENRGLSFHPISSIGANGAIVHYRATEENNSKISRQIYLLDSGGQYPGGTTDVTRTVHFGTPTAEEKEAYTQVLKGHLALRHAVFPECTSGRALDVLARQYLWRGGRNYYHGTGHGVGAYLNVHEGPQAITLLRKPRSGDLQVVYLEPGMTLSNEPGYYKEGHFGIRIENVVYVKRVEGEFSKDHTNYLTFEDLTLVPYCKDLMDMEMLTEEEVKWINEYHHMVAETLIPRMEQLSPSMYTDAIQYLLTAAEPLRK
ncbi:metallopeptidase M24 family protein [Babesia divergens]|uniref:Metallopeptidase M24 family protein n=1 Tax=Babesia divergens TaxID=32595 RepID=A0AAD9LF31_BABDI|nr:metallopeptidase M24 family protein [Babesia divergens]